MVNIITIPRNEQRYRTVGDWEFNSGELNIKVSKSDSKETDYLIAIHEMIEAILCQYNGVLSTEVDSWDMSHLNHPDPGSIPGCPYYREHMVATMIERLMAAELQVDWDEHEEILEEQNKKL